MKKYNAPKVKESRGIRILTSIWLVPFIALIIALWLAYQYYIQIGSKITIRFKSNAGLIENQSPIKMRDVTIGIVKKISLSKDGKGVIINARMNREVDDYLNSKAKFWIVHPDVGTQGISGLDTIVSGSYIQLYGIKDTKAKKIKHYIGLEHPYIDDNAKGKYFVLSAPKSYNVSEKGIIYYRMMKIGRVERVAISPDGTHVNFTIFIEDDYIKYINSRSKFYARSNFNIDFSNRNLDISTAPFSQIIHGGISLYTPIDTLDKNNTIREDKIFHLYKNFADMRSKQLVGDGEDKFFKLTFKNKANKLQIGTPIEFKNFRVGYITDIRNSYSKKHRKIESYIYALIRTDIFNKKELNGLKAKISSINIPVIGADYIELFFDNRHKTPLKKDKENYYIIPTIKKRAKKDIMSDVRVLIAKLQKLPLKKLLNSTTNLVNENRKPINSLVKSLNRTVNSLDKTIKRLDDTLSNINRFTSKDDFIELPTTINNSLAQLQSTLLELEELTNQYGGDSKFSEQISLTLEAISEASKSFNRTNEILNQKANALILGDE